MESPNVDNANILNNNNLTTTTTTDNVNNINDIVENDNNNNTTENAMHGINDNDAANVSDSNDALVIKTEEEEEEEEHIEDNNEQLDEQQHDENGNEGEQNEEEQDQQHHNAGEEVTLQDQDFNVDCNQTQETTSNEQNNQQQQLSKAGVIRVQESQEDGAESIELELEEDSTLLLTSLTSLFPDATGLKYKHPETNTFRGVKLVDGRFAEPLNGWSSVQSYICVFNRGTKRKNNNADDQDSTANSRSKQTKTDVNKQAIAGNGSDLVVLGLPWTTTEDSMRNYFEQYGEVSMVQVKTDPKSGKSRGFGFVRFAKSSIQNKLLSMRHFIDGRWCDVRIPLSKAEAEATRQAHLSRKIFVGRLPDDITTDDLRNHFSEYGTLTDVFIPKPFRNFAFVTFGTSDMAQSLFKHEHVIKGSQIQISEAIPKDNGPQPNNHHHTSNKKNTYGNNFNSGGPQGNNNNYVNSGYGGNNNNNIHPFNSNYNTHQASHQFHHKNNFTGGNFGVNMYQNARKMHPQSTYYQMPSYGNSGPSGGVDSSSYVNHSAHSDYTTFGGGGAAGLAPTGYQQAANVNGGQYYKIQQQQQQQQPIIAPNPAHSTYPNQPSYSSNHGANFSRTSYNSVWK